MRFLLLALVLISGGFAHASRDGGCSFGLQVPEVSMRSLAQGLFLGDEGALSWENLQKLTHIRHLHRHAPEIPIAYWNILAAHRLELSKVPLMRGMASASVRARPSSRDYLISIDTSIDPPPLDQPEVLLPLTMFNTDWQSIAY